jgi:hypothetical protein
MIFRRKRDESECAMSKPEEEPSERVVEARRQREISEKRLISVLPLASTLREMRRKNHIGELLDELIERRAGGGSP